jgi:TPR repeat protein
MLVAIHQQIDERSPAARRGQELILQALEAASDAPASVVPASTEPAPDLADLARRAQAGDALAQRNLGVVYLGGHGVPADLGLARLWLEKAAARGMADAALNLGDLYFDGRLAAKDEALALKWYETAARLDDETGLHNAAVMYREGQGTPADPVRAYGLALRLAMLHGSPPDPGAFVTGMAKGLDAPARARALAIACELYLGHYEAPPIFQMP